MSQEPRQTNADAAGHAPTTSPKCALEQSGLEATAAPDQSLVCQTQADREDLRQRATFAMSLGAKELFHTNFLAFLLEAQDPNLDELQRQLRLVLGIAWQPKQGERPYCHVWREHNRLDLVVVPVVVDRQSPDGESASTSRCLVVEAKLKAIPTWQQLNEYLEKNLSLPYPSPDSKQKVRFRLGPLQEPPAAGKGRRSRARVPPRADRVLLAPAGTPSVHGDWSSVCWEALAAAIETCANTLPADAPDSLRHILVDYALALKSVLRLIAATRRRQRQLENTAFRYKAFYDELVHEELRSIRLHDLVGKVAFDQWVRSLFEEVKRRLEAEHLGNEFRRITPYVHFSNGSPGLDLEVDYGGLQVGIQVQGMQLRRYVSSKDERDTLEQEILDGPLLQHWLTQYACGSPLTGLDDKPPQREEGRLRRSKKTKEPRHSNLRAFNAKKFLYTAIGLNTVTLKQVHEEALASIASAVQLPRPR